MIIREVAVEAAGLLWVVAGHLWVVVVLKWAAYLREACQLSEIGMVVAVAVAVAVDGNLPVAAVLLLLLVFLVATDSSHRPLAACRVYHRLGHGPALPPWPDVLPPRWQACRPT